MLRAGFFVGVALAHLVAGTGCYQPELRDCTVSCNKKDDCTGGQICRADGWCAMPEIMECPKGGDTEQNDATADAAVTQQDADNTAQMLCQAGCTKGVCVNGTCVIDCSAPDSCNGADVKCAPNLPCRVICGARSCEKKIFCETATSCEVQCNGDNSCRDDIVCNANRCDVDCVGAGSCKKTKCTASCACDVTCSGVGSCTDPNECPDSACKLGEGCSSLLAGCNTCS